MQFLINIRTTVSESTEDHSVFSEFTSDDYSETENSSESIQATTESTKSFQHLQMLHPVCIFDYSVSQSSNMPPPASSYPDSSDPSITQNREFPFQKSPYHGFPSSNYMQLQANTMQFIPGFGYAGNLPQAQPAEQGPMGSGASKVSPITLDQQSMAKTPYFCGYMSLPILHFSSISDTLQSDRSSVDKAKDSPPEEPRKLFQKDGTIVSQDYSGINDMSWILRNDSFKVSIISLFFFLVLLTTYVCYGNFKFKLN